MTTIVNDVSDVGIYNIVADQGTTFMRSITYKSSTGAVGYNLGSGASAQMKVRKSYPAIQTRAAYRDPAVLFIGNQAASVYTSTATITIASPAVVTEASHGFMTNDVIKFSTTLALPTGLTAGTSYYVIYLTPNTFSVSLTPNGPAINTSGTQSGTHSVVSAIYTQALTLTTASGIIDIKIPAATMAAVPAGIYDYDLEITAGSTGLNIPSAATGDVIKVIRGLFEVRQEMTY